MRACLLILASLLCACGSSNPRTVSPDAGTATSTTTRPLPVTETSSLPRGLELQDVQGATRHPFDTAHVATVLLFVATDCPVSNGYAPEMNRIVQEYTPRGVAFYFVYADADTKPDEARDHAAMYGFKAPALIDPHQVLVKTAEATATPEAAVYLGSGIRAYRGRIDDKIVDYGKHREEATRHDLRLALDAILAGKPVEVATTDVIGCPISVEK